MQNINIQDILGGIAPNLLPGDRLPEVGDYNTKEGRNALNEAVKAFYNNPPITKNNVLTLEEQTYSLACGIAFEIRDLYNDLEKGGKQNPSFHQKLDNMFRWVMDNFNAVFVVGIMRTILGVFSIRFNPDLLSNWKEFANRYKDLILAS